MQPRPRREPVPHGPRRRQHPLPARRDSTTTPTSCRTGGFCTRGGSTWTATSATPTASGRSTPTARTRRSCGATTPPAPARSFNSNRGPQVSFDRPELSPCLKTLKDKSPAKYAEALAVIQAGKDMLRKRPRADMPGFGLSGEDRRRQDWYILRRQIELRNREAIRTGRKAYDQE